MVDIKYQNTFGCEAWGLARVTEHKPLMAALYLVGGGIVTFNMGWAVAPIALILLANDWKAIDGATKAKDPRTIWVLDDDEEETPLLEAAEDKPVEVVAEPIPEKEDSPVAEKFAEPTYDTVAYGSSNPWAKTTPSAKFDRSIPLTEFEKNNREEMEKHRLDDDDETSNFTKASTFGNLGSGIAKELITMEDDYLRSWFITGLTGTGKGVFFTFALLLAKNNLKGVNLWGVDPKADPDEFRRWAIIPENQRFHFDAARPDLDSDARKLIEEGLKDLFNRYYADPSPYKILLLDELPAIVATVTPKYRKELISFVCRTASMGRSKGRAVWVGSNTVGLRENGLSKSGRDFFHEVYLVTPRNVEKVTGHSSFPGTKIEPGILNITGRAAWVSTTSKWYAIPQEYLEAVNELIPVEPPANLGSGEFKGQDTAVAVREIAEELAETLETMGVNSLRLEELVDNTSLGDMELETIEEKVIPALSMQRMIIILKKKRGVWYAQLPLKEEPEGYGLDLQGAAQQLGII